MRCIRVRVIASRISATQVDSRSNAVSTLPSPACSRSRRDSSLRASTMSDTPAIIRSSSSTGRRMLRAGAVGAAAGSDRLGGGEQYLVGLVARLEREDQRLVAAFGIGDAGGERLDQLADPVDDQRAPR